MQTSDVVARYVQIARTRPSEAQVKDLENIIKTLELQDSDAFIDILICLEYYRKLYTEIPDKVEIVTQNALDRAEQNANAVLNNINSNIKYATQLKCIIYGFIVFVLGGVLFGVACIQAHDRGYARGYAEMQQIAEKQQQIAEKQKILEKIEASSQNQQQEKKQENLEKKDTSKTDSSRQKEKNTRKESSKRQK